MRSTLSIVSVTSNEDSTITIEFSVGPIITLTQQEWDDEIYQCQTNYPMPLMRSLLLQKYFADSQLGTVAVFDTDAPNSAWIEKNG
jgi:multidrug efflux pump subunit AcrB